MREWTRGTRRGMRLRKRRGVINFAVKKNSDEIIINQFNYYTLHF